MAKRPPGYDDWHVTGAHGIVFNPPMRIEQWELLFGHYVDPQELREWQKRCAQEAYEKKYGKPKESPKPADAGQLKLTPRRRR